jgi:putative nucleotidyltransferase with HDIG domain
VIGARIGNYRIVTELGAGAMGEVYFAEHTVMGRRAAVKVIRQGLSSNAEMVERFVNEARLVNRIGHPNIVEITDFGQIDGRYYIMMELLEGETLEERLERTGHLSESQCLRIALQITAALGAAHELGVVHRDLKPENIYLQHRGGQSDFVKVLDFGIAKLMGSMPSVTAGTLPGTLLGTPHYMSPEQCFGSASLDHRSDVYALGVILYRALTGVLPFDGDTLLAILHAQATIEPQPLREHRPEITTHLEAVVLKAMAKQPAERFQTMTELQAALAGKPLAPRAAVAAPHAAPAAAASLPRTSGTADTQDLLDEPAKPQPTAAHGGTLVPNQAGRRRSPGGVTLTRAREEQRATDPAAERELPDAAPDDDPKQGQRVGSKLARILVERIHKGKLVLPNMPSAARKCIELLDKPNGGLTEVAQAIGRDPIIAPQVIRRAKSALLQGHSPVRTIDQAVQRLGARPLRAILVDLCARKLFESKNPAIRRATRGLWEHSVAVAVLSRAIARRRRDVDPDVAYLSGLLHDVGKPVAASLLLEAERDSGARPEEWLGKNAWLDVISECHREVGVALARSWQLQDEVVMAIARSERYPLEGAGTPASVVCFANAIAKREGIYTGEFDHDAVEALIRDGMQLFRVSPEMLTALLGELHDPSETGDAASQR